MFPYIVIDDRSTGELDADVPTELMARIAFVLMIGLQDGDIPSRRDRYAEERLVLAVVDAVAIAIGADAMRIEDFRDSPIATSSLDDFQRSRIPPQSDGSEDIHVPSRVLFTHKGVNLGLMVCEGWFNIGGPWPWHDSYTYATCVRDSVVRDKVFSEITGMCSRSGIPQPERVVMDDS